MSTAVAEAVPRDARRPSSLGFVLSLAWREARGAPRLLLVLAATVAIGVAALVAIRSFTDALRESVKDQARSLLGADLALGTNGPISPEGEAVVADMRQATGGTTARLTTLGAMVYVPDGTGSRLVQVVGVEGAYPFYGRILTEPASAWGALAEGRRVVVDPSLLTALDAKVGDELAVGEARFRIDGVVKSVPGDVGMRSALGPRVFMAAKDLTATGLDTFGARVRREVLFAVPEGTDTGALARRFRPRLMRERMTLRTVADSERSLTGQFERLGRFLGLVGLSAVLLGGLGVASATRVLVRRKLETVAILRCLGASGRSVLAAYVLQAAVLGLVGSVAGVALGALVQASLPRLVGDLLPVDVTFSLSPSAVLWGVAVGLGVSVSFALVPLLAVRQVTPLLLLRRSVEPEGRPRVDVARALALLGVAATVVLISVAQAPRPAMGVVFAAVMGAVLGALWLTARGLVAVLHRLRPRRIGYAWRHGLANLQRPDNQTAAVVVALGFGAFLLSLLVILQASLLRQIRFDETGARPNVVFFDVQPDQWESLGSEMAKAGVTPRPATAIVPMRIASLRGVSAANLLGATAYDRREPPGGGQGAAPRGGWAVRREYRSTSRDEVVASERIVAGSAWPPGAGKAALAAGRPVPVSLEVELARELGVSVGDLIVWDVQGVAVPSRVTTLREVQWARFEPNFFAVFAAGALEGAPSTLVTMARVEDPSARVRLVRAVAERFPNVSGLDITEIQRAIEAVLDRVAMAIRFMAVFSLGTGAIVLAGALLATREQRLRESAVLKALGATRAQLLRITVAEHLTLGLLAVAAADVLACVVGPALLRYVFDASWSLPLGPLFGLGAVLVSVTVAVGWVSTATAFRRNALAALKAD